MKESGVSQPSDKCTDLFGVPSPISAPRLIRPNRTSDKEQCKTRKGYAAELLHQSVEFIGGRQRISQLIGVDHEQKYKECAGERSNKRRYLNRIRVHAQMKRCTVVRDPPRSDLVHL